MSPQATGADGCRGGWVVARYDGAGYSFSFAEDFAAVVEGAPGVVAVDMPVVLADDGAPRECDALAKRRLGRRASTIFPAPARPLLACSSYPEALARSRALYGRGLSVQTYHLFPKIREVQPFAARVVEAHPELAFLEMNGGVELPPKKTDEGRTLRAALLGGVEKVRLAGAGRDDVLDAAAVAWTAWRVARGEAGRLGEGAAAIWY